MLAARMHGYKQPLVLEDVEKPPITADQVLVRVEAAGMCRTDFQMVDGYFKDYLNLAFPATPGHEIAGSVAELGGSVPASANLKLGDQVVVVGGWGDGTCRQCRMGNEQICGHGAWPGFGPYGGYSEYVPIPYRYLIRIDPRYKLKSEELAPLTDAGLTPYRGMKKLRAAGVVGPDRRWPSSAPGVWGCMASSTQSSYPQEPRLWRSREVMKSWRSRKTMVPTTSSTRGQVFRGYSHSARSADGSTRD